MNNRILIVTGWNNTEELYRSHGYSKDKYDIFTFEEIEYNCKDGSLLRVYSEALGNHLKVNDYDVIIGHSLGGLILYLVTQQNIINCKLLIFANPAIYVRNYFWIVLWYMDKVQCIVKHLSHFSAILKSLDKHYVNSKLVLHEMLLFREKINIRKSDGQKIVCINSLIDVFVDKSFSKYVNCDKVITLKTFIHLTTLSNKRFYDILIERY